METNGIPNQRFYHPAAQPRGFLFDLEIDRDV